MIKRIKDHIKRNKDRLLLMKLSSLLVLVNFFTTITIVKNLGFSDKLDIFYISMTVFYFLASSITWSLASVLAPLLIHKRGEGIEGKMFVNVAIIIIPVSIMAFLTMFFWGQLLFVNYLDKLPFNEIMLIQGIFLAAFCIDGLTLVPFAMFQEKNRYVAISFISLIAAVTGLVMVYLLIPTFGVYIAAGNQLLIKLILFAVLTISVFPHLYKTIGFDAKQFSTLWKKARYMLFGSLYYKTDEISERFIASYLTGGFVSLVAFIQRVYGAFITVVNSAIGVPSITVFSNLVKVEDYTTIKKTLLKYILTLLAIDSLLFIGIIFIGKFLILSLLNGEVDEALLPILPLAIMLLFSLVFGKTIEQVLQSLLLSMGKEKLLTIYDSITFTINLSIKIGLTVMHGMEGLLIAIMLSTLITSTAKLYLAYKEINKLSKN